MAYEHSQEVLELIKVLDPTISLRYTDEQLLIFIEIASTLVSPDIPDDKEVLAVALLTLDMLSKPEQSNITSKQIAGVRMTYTAGASTSKWKEMYDSLVSGEATSETSVHYVGI